MDDESSSDLQKCSMDTDEGPLINENSNGLSHLLTESEFNSVDAAAADESSVSDQAFLNAVELSAESAGDYLENNTTSFNTFDVGDNAVNFPSDTMNNSLTDGVASDTDADTTENSKMRINNEEFENDTNETTDLTNTMPTSDLFQTKDSEDNTSDKNPSDIIIIKHDGAQDLLINKENVETMDHTSNIDENTESSMTGLEMKQKEENISAEENEIVERDNNSLSISDDNIKDIKSESTDIKPNFSQVNNILSIQNVELILDDKENSTFQEDIKSTQSNTLFEKSNLEIKEKCDEVLTPIKKSAKVGSAEETEVVSEDEFPEVQKPSVKDAENVSDDELPGPKPAELPADTEVVSEDELPTSKKEIKESRKRKPEDTKLEGYDPGSPTSECESANKKQAITKNGESKPISTEKRPSIDEKPKKKVLPELDKYWKVVNDDPTDFTGWTYLLQYVDQESDVEAAREAYDAFLSHYPYCYGYWRKYADYEKRKGSKKKCLEVLERGLKAIPLSVDLWIHYLNHIKSIKTDEHAYIRAQYERAIDACGLEFRSDRLWESYIKWEAENGSALNVTNIYDRLLVTPTLGYTAHFDNFQEHVMAEPVAGLIGHAELVRLRGEVRDSTGLQPQLDLPPGEDEPSDHVASEEEAQAIKERIITARRKIHKTTGEEVAARWAFEEGIKRPYFHVKPLERCQLKNWKAYLEWEKQHGSLKRILVLHERCLIACALYEEFWMRLIKFLEERAGGEPELVAVERDVLERACTVHHLDKAELHLLWAHFEEVHGQAARAAEILDRIDKACPNNMQVQYRRVNLERRRGDHEKCAQLYEGYIAAAKNKALASALAVKYARFQFHVRREPAAARAVLDAAVARDPLNPRLHLQRLDLAVHTPAVAYEELEELVRSYEKQAGAELEVSVSMAWRWHELAEELGPAEAARTAQAHARTLAKHLRKRARKDKHEAPPPPANITAEPPAKKKESVNVNQNANVVASSPYYASGNTPYEQSYAQPYQAPWGYQQPSAPYQHHGHAWPQYPNYY